MTDEEFNEHFRYYELPNNNLREAWVEVAQRRADLRREMRELEALESEIVTRHNRLPADAKERG